MQLEDILQSEVGQRLRNLIERVERLEEEKDTIARDIAEIYKEAKSTGFSDKVMRRLVALRSKDDNTVKDEEALLKIYKTALGME